MITYWETEREKEERDRKREEILGIMKSFTERYCQTIPSPEKHSVKVDTPTPCSLTISIPLRMALRVSRPSIAQEQRRKWNATKAFVSTPSKRRWKKAGKKRSKEESKNEPDIQTQLEEGKPQKRDATLHVLFNNSAESVHTLAGPEVVSPALPTHSILESP